VAAAEVLQGSVVTYLRCSGEYNTGPAADLLQNPSVKEFLKSIDICESYA